MFSRREVYREIIQTIVKVLSGTSLALASFISIVFILTLDVPGNTVRVSGYDVVFTSTLAIYAVVLSFFLLAFACLLTASLLLIGTKHDSDFDS